MALFMNSANLVHLDDLLKDHRKEETEKVEEVLNGLLSLPRWTGMSEFKGLKTDDRSKLQVWKLQVS